MVTAAGCAHINRIPMLLLPGDIFATRRPHPVLQGLEEVKHHYSVNEAFKPVSVFFDRIYRPEQLVDCLPKVAKILTDPLTYGPVTLSLPQDLQAEEFLRTWCTIEPNSVLTLNLSIKLKRNLRGGKRIYNPHTLLVNAFHILFFAQRFSFSFSFRTELGLHLGLALEQN